MIWLWGADRYEPYLQAMHFMFGLGAFLAPIAIEAALAATATAESPAGDFGPSFFVIAVTMAAFATPLLCTRGPQPSAEERAKAKGASSKRGGACGVIRDAVLALLPAALKGVRRHLSARASTRGLRMCACPRDGLLDLTWIDLTWT